MPFTFDDQKALFTTKFADKTAEIVPEHTIICDKIKFNERARVGDMYEVPISLTRSAGVTYNTGGGTYSLNGSVSPKFERAKVKGSVLWVLESITEEALTRGRGGEKAFLNETKPVVSNLFSTMGYRMELETMYGTSGLARSAVGVGSVTAAGTTCTVIVDDAYWAAGIWLGSEYGTFDIYEAIGDALPKNATTALILTGVNTTTKTLTFTCSAADVAALEALGTAAIIFFRGAKTGATTYAEAEGIHSLISKTTGSIHEINVATYSMWKGMQINIGGALTFAQLQNAMLGPVNAGLKQDVLVIVSPKTWSRVMNNEAALRAYDQSYSEKKMKNGAKSLEFYGQNGLMEIVAHPYMWEGFAHVIRPEKWKRVGSSEPHFPEFGTDHGFYKVPSTNYYNIEVTKDSAIMTESPSSNVVISGITNV